ncbi:MAG: hypothetical protein ACK5O7_03690 [Holosporales bacterium]
MQWILPLSLLSAIWLAGCTGTCSSCAPRHKAEHKREPMTRNLPDDTVGTAARQKEMPRPKVYIPSEGLTSPHKTGEDGSH